MTGGHAHLLSRLERGLHEDLRERQAVGREVVVTEPVRDVGGVEQREGPRSLPESARLHEPGGRSPDGCEVLVREPLERCDEPPEVHPRIAGGRVEARDGGDLAVIERGRDEARAWSGHGGPRFVLVPVASLQEPLVVSRGGGHILPPVPFGRSEHPCEPSCSFSRRASAPPPASRSLPARRPPRPPAPRAKPNGRPASSGAWGAVPTRRTKTPP